MDTVNSFKGYGKVDPAQEAAFRKKTRKRIIILSVSVILLLVLVIAIVAGTAARRRTHGGGSTIDAALKSICGVTLYPESCIASLGGSNSSDPEKVFRLSLSLLASSLQRLTSFPGQYSTRTENPMVKQALIVCGTVLSDAVDSLNDSVSALGAPSSQRVDDLKTWLSTVITDQQACLDALGEVNATFVDEVKLLMRNATELASNGLAIVSKLIGILKDFKIPGSRRLLSGDGGGFPSWVTPADRRLLQSSQPVPNVTVARDGTGDVMTVAAAVQRIPSKSNYRFVIYVKSGVYVENVLLLKSHWNVMIYGDGMTATVISGSLNFVDGTPTFSTATF
ncbi:hypothetical protein M569_11324, partial [Genlisea aurea]